MTPNSINTPPLIVDTISNNLVSRKNYYSKPIFPYVRLKKKEIIN